MKSLTFYILIIFTFCQCGSTNGIIEPCTSKNEKNIADKFLGKKKYDLSKYFSSVEEDGGEFIINYELKDTMMRGGGAMINISKETCKITKSKLFQ